jgi:small subunit ribosomal protein S4
MVNGKSVNIPSYRLRPGDIVSIREKSKDLIMVQSALDSGERRVPEYISVDDSKRSAVYIRKPELQDVPYPVEMHPHLVVEFYSR